jgi:hypothetical protein
MDLNNNVDVLKKQMDLLMSKLTPEQRKFAKASIEEINKATTPEEVNKIRDEEIEKAKNI